MMVGHKLVIYKDIHKNIRIKWTAKHDSIMSQRLQSFHSSIAIFHCINVSFHTFMYSYCTLYTFGLLHSVELFLTLCTQSFVDSFTEGLRKEYASKGIIVQVHVCCISCTVLEMIPFKCDIPFTAVMSWHAMASLVYAAELDINSLQPFSYAPILCKRNQLPDHFLSVSSLSPALRFLA